MVAGGVVAAPAAAVAAAVTAAAAVAVTAMLRPAAVVVADLQWKTVPESKGWVDAPLSLQISLEDPAFNVSFLATLSTDASGAAVSPVNGAAYATASDDAVPADDSSNVSCLAALSTDASGAAVSPVDGAAVNAAVSSAEEGTLAAPPPPMQWGKQFRRSPALLQVLPPMPRSLTTWALPPHPSTTQQGRHWCRSPLQPQVLLQQVPLPSAPTATVPPTGRTSAQMTLLT